MVYKRFIKKDGKMVGPYLYKSVRQKDGSVKSIYVGQAEKSSITLHPSTFWTIAILSIVILLIIFRSVLTGFFIYPSPETFSKDISILTSDSGSYELELDHDFFELSSFSISGSMTGENARVFLEIENKSYLVGDFSKLSSLGLAGYAIAEFESASEQSEVEQPVEEQEIVPAPVETVPVEQLAEEPVVIIDETIETPTEQPAEQTPAESIVESASPEQNIQTSETITENPIEFSESCKETCDLSEIMIGKTKVKLRIELTNAQISINKITYSIRDLKNALNIDDESLKQLKETGKVKAIFDIKEVGSETSIQAAEESVSEEVTVTRKFSESNSFAGELTKEDLRNILYNRNIESVSFDSVNRILLSESVPLINATSVWQKQIDGVNVTGKGYAACVIDTGVSEHTALSGRIIGNHCFCSVSGPCCTNNQTENEDGNDDNSHGTHVAGTIASNDAVYTGVAPEANIVAVKVCNSAGYCSSSDMIAGVEYCINKSEEYNISVISISIGGGGYTDYCEETVPAMTSAINSAREKGIIVSIASGNNGYSDKVTWPACIQGATTVMATDKSDNVASYSNRNSIVDLAATGGSASNPITSTVLNNGFAGKYGTSMAAPHVSGAVILLMQYSKLYTNFVLSPDKIEEMLKNTGKLINDSASGLTFRRIDVLSAIQPIPKINQEENSIESPGKSKIIFSDSTNLENWEAFSFENNFISLDSELYPEFNKPANITFYNLMFEKNPVILKNSEACMDCNVLDYSNKTLLFSMQGFSEYTSVANAQLNTFDINQTALINQNVMFYANYTSRIDSSAINGTCIIRIDNSSYSMEFNEAYIFNKTFLKFGEYPYSINCTSADFETMSTANSINITKITSSINLTLNGKSSNLSILLNQSVLINASLINPIEGYLKLYLNNSLINEGNNSVSGLATFTEFGNSSVSAVYEENENYYSANKVLWIDIINDTFAPKYSNILGLNDVYGKNKTYHINITWQDEIGIDSVWISHNFAGNFSDHSLSGIGEYSYIWNDLKAGTYSAEWFSNDSSGNLNSTGMLNLTINKSSNPVTLYLNNVQGNLTINYESQINATAYSEGNVSLYKDGIEINNSASMILPVKSYVYKANATGNENFTDNSAGVSYTLTVGKAEPSLQLYFNNNQGDLTFVSSAIVELKAILSPAVGNISIYQNDAKISEGISPFIISRNLSSVGTYKINATFAGNENYSAKSRTNYIYIQAPQQQQPLQQPKQPGAAPQTGVSECTTLWQCSEWTSCTLGKKTRTCSDVNSCGTDANKPVESISCGCQENWKCSNWTACSEGKQTRTCTDLNSCSAQKTESKMCFFPAMPFDLSKIVDIASNIESVGKTINYLKTNVLPITKKPVFFISVSAAILGALIFIFRNNLVNAAKGLRKYRLNVRFKIAKVKR